MKNNTPDKIINTTLKIICTDSFQRLTIRRIAVKACGQIPSPILVSHLFRLYHLPELRAYVLETLEQMPEEYVATITNASQNPNLDETSRTLLFQVLASIGGQAAQRHLWGLFSGNSSLLIRVAAGNALWQIALK